MAEWFLDSVQKSFLNQDLPFFELGFFLINLRKKSVNNFWKIFHTTHQSVFMNFEAQVVKPQQPSKGPWVTLYVAYLNR